MTATELRELDTWIAENVFNWKPAQANVGKMTEYGPEKVWGWWNTKGMFTTLLPNYTTDPISAMEVLKMCDEPSDIISIYKSKGKWVVFTDWHNSQKSCRSEAPALELAICLFAKKLFSQPTES